MTLQTRIEKFVREYSPRDYPARKLFIDQLRDLLNEYADAALIHEARPEIGIDHGHGPGPSHKPTNSRR